MPGVESTNSTSSQPIFWERIREWWNQYRETQPMRDRPPRRGLVVSLCLLISFLLWFTLTLRNSYTVTMNMPTMVVNVPENEALSRLPPSTIRMQVNGEGYELLRLHYNPLTIPIDASEDQVDLISSARNVTTNVRVESVTPQTFELSKEPVATRTVPIDFRGEVNTPPTHDLLESPSIDPDSVTVVGAESVIEDLELWPTEEITLSDVQDSMSVHVELADTLSGLVEKNRVSTTLEVVSVPFTEGTREIPVRVTGVPGDVVTLEPSTVRIRYRVPLDEYDEVEEAEDLFATVAYDDIRADTTGRVRPVVNVPADLAVRDVEVFPNTLRYYIALQN